MVIRTGRSLPSTKIRSNSVGGERLTSLKYAVLYRASLQSTPGKRRLKASSLGGSIRGPDSDNANMCWRGVLSLYWPFLSGKEESRFTSVFTSVFFTLKMPSSPYAHRVGRAPYHINSP